MEAATCPPIDRDRALEQLAVDAEPPNHCCTLLPRQIFLLCVPFELCFRWSFMVFFPASSDRLVKIRWQNRMETFILNWNWFL